MLFVVVADPLAADAAVFPVEVLAVVPVGAEAFVVVPFMVAVAVPPDGGTESVILFLFMYLRLIEVIALKRGSRAWIGEGEANTSAFLFFRNFWDNG